MSGIDEQKPICPICRKIPSHFRFFLKWEGRNYSIWLLDGNAMTKFEYTVPVVFDVGLSPISKKNRFVDKITSVRCNDCSTTFDDVVVVDKLVTILRRMLNQCGDKILGDTR